MHRTVGLMLVLAVFTALWRVLPHEVNMTPLFALALFAGAQLKPLQASALTLATVLLSDLLLGFHNTMLFVYAGLMLAVGIGSLLRQKTGIALYAGASLATSLTFFMISNFGVWLVAELYPLTAAGLLQSYVMALPFLWKSVASDLFFTLLFFAVFATLGKRSPTLTAVAR